MKPKPKAKRKPKVETPPDPLLRERIREYFGFRKFRPGQAEAVDSALGGGDTLVVMPTGSGKSLCFQLTALALEGITVVVSPLISLMKDQVDNLLENGVWAVGLNSTLTREQHTARLMRDAFDDGGRSDLVLTHFIEQMSEEESASLRMALERLTPPGDGR